LLREREHAGSSEAGGGAEGPGVAASTAPVPEVVTLENGLRVVASPMAHARSVSISVYVAAGARYEAAPADAGLSHFVEHLCFKGTARRPNPRAVAVEIDALGGSINAATDRELTVYYAKVIPEHAEQALDMLVDVVHASLFRDEEIERERGVILEELAAVEDAPDEQVGIVLDGLLWPDQPIGRDVAGTPASVTAIETDRLREYYREQYVANGVVIALGGAIEADAAHELVRRTSSGWASGTAATDWVRAQAQPEGARVQVLAKDTEQAHLSLGMRGLDASDEDRYALGLLSVVLGEGMSSRLFMRLREELGLCYDVHSGASYLRDAGTFAIHAGVDPANTLATVEEIVRELGRVRSTVTAEELQRAQQLVRSRVQLHMEDSRAVSGWYGTRVALDLPLRDPDESVACYERVTLEDVGRVAERLIREDALHLAVVGPVADPAPLEARLHFDG
jgi:predicted Zn-dependent peptidase